MRTHKILNEDLSVFEFNIEKELNFSNLAMEAKNYYKEHNIIHKFGKIDPKLIDYGLHHNTTKFNSLISVIENKTSFIIDSLHLASNIKVIPKVEESWVIVYNKLNFLTPHKHHMWSYSAVCYLETDNPSSIVFNKTEIIPKTGMLLIFSGSLTHGVRPVTIKNGERIAFICNLYPTTKIIDVNLKMRLYE